jgi:hypothetical protein
MSKRSLIALLTTLCVAPLRLALGAEIAPGTVIAKENLASAKELLIPSMQWMVENGLAIRVVAPKSVPWPSRYKEATEKYASQVKLSPDGRSLTGYVAGLPFPNVDPNDPQAAFKVMWNQELKPVYTDDVQTEFIFELTDATGNVERTQIWDRWRRLFWSGRLYHDPKPEIPHDPPIRFTELFGPALAPEDIRNTSALSIRYVDADTPDDTYLYLPQLRRVRRVPVNNRTDSIFGTDMDLDSTWGFASKVGNFSFKVLAVSRAILAPVHSGKYGVADLYQMAPGGGVKSWMPDGSWEKRDVWVIEGQPRISPYAFSRGIFYVDREFWQMNFTEWFDKKGELWKIWWNMFNFTDEPRSGKVFTEPGTGLRVQRATTPAGMEADLLSMHTTKWRAPSPHGLERGTDWRFDAGAPGDNIPDYHTVSHMVEIGR